MPVKIRMGGSAKKKQVKYLGDINFSNIANNLTYDIKDKVPDYQKVKLEDFAPRFAKASSAGGGQSSGREFRTSSYNPVTGILTYNVTGSNYAGGHSVTDIVALYVMCEVSGG